MKLQNSLSVYDHTHVDQIFFLFQKYSVLSFLNASCSSPLSSRILFLSSTAFSISFSKIRKEEKQLQLNKILAAILKQLASWHTG